MITRPLDLASKLRAEPRNFDWLFYVNVGVIALFFSLFGSRFVLAPGVTVLPEIAGANDGARVATHYITVNSERQIIAGDGPRDLPALALWFEKEAQTVKQPVLLVQYNAGNDAELLARIITVANAAGFVTQVAAVEPRKRAERAGK